MRGRMIAHGGFANRGVDYGVYFLPHANCLLGDDLMRAHSLHGVIAAGHFGPACVVIVGVAPSALADLAAGFGIEGRVVEDDFAGVAGLEFLSALIALDDGENFAGVIARLAIAFGVGFRELLVGGIGRLLGCAFPGGASTLALLRHRSIKPGLVKRDALITACILDEVFGQSECIVELESDTTGQFQGIVC